VTSELVDLDADFELRVSVGRRHHSTHFVNFDHF